MKLRLAILGVIGAATLATSSLTPTPAATDYHIGDDAYAIPGAEVRSFLYCRAGRRVGIYELRATDALPWRYWLLLGSADASTARVDAVGPVRVDGADATWLPHTDGEAAVVAIDGGACDVPVARIGPIWRRWLPRIVR
jgi:hypothetical protein